MEGTPRLIYFNFSGLRQEMEADRIQTSSQNVQQVLGCRVGQEGVGRLRPKNGIRFHECWKGVAWLLLASKSPCRDFFARGGSNPVGGAAVHPNIKLGFPTLRTGADRPAEFAPIAHIYFFKSNPEKGNIRVLGTNRLLIFPWLDVALQCLQKPVEAPAALVLKYPQSINMAVFQKPQLFHFEYIAMWFYEFPQRVRGPRRRRRKEKPPDPLNVIVCSFFFCGKAKPPDPLDGFSVRLHMSPKSLFCWALAMAELGI